MKLISNFILGMYFKQKRVRLYAWLSVTAVVCVFVFCAGSLMTSPVGWERVYSITPYQTAVSDFDFVVRGDFVAVGYEAAADNRAGIYCTVSFNAGGQFLSPVLISSAPATKDGFLARPRIAISKDGHIAAVWQSISNETVTNHIYYSISKNFGATWSDPKLIEAPSTMEFLPQPFYDENGALHLFFQALQQTGSFIVFHSMSTDEITFPVVSQVMVLPAEMRGAFFPSIVFNGDNVFMVWQGKGLQNGVLTDNLYFTASSNTGKSWGKISAITSSSGSNASPCMIMHEKTLYIAYQNNDSKNWAVRLMESTDGGRKWNLFPETVSTTNTNCYGPNVSVFDTGDLLVLWADTRDGISRIYSRRYVQRENKFLKEVALSEGTKSARRPHAGVVGGRMVATWDDGQSVMAMYSDVHAEAPVVTSFSNPDGSWSRSTDAVVNWVSPPDNSGIAGYATMVNKIAYFNPMLQNVDGKQRSIRLSNLDDGISYFHIRTIDGAGNYSRTVHYKLQVSSTPMPMPAVESPTHPEGKAVSNSSPFLRWSVDDTQRLKGYRYSLSPDVVRPPEKFAAVSEVNFSNLKEGRYFFSIQAVDKANQLGKVATYELIVGRAENIDSSVYENIARGETGGVKKNITAALLPSVDVVLPFDTARSFMGNSFSIQLVPRNDRNVFMSGYAVKIDRDINILPDKITSTGSSVVLSVQSSGEYYITVRGVYAYSKLPGAQTFLTQPVQKKISVIIPPSSPPLDIISKEFSRVLSGKEFLALTALGVLLFAVIFVGFGTRLVFYGRMMRYRMMTAIRLVLITFSE